MMELQSLEAEHGVLGAMLRQPHLIDVLSEDLAAAAFAWEDNADLYRLILELHADGHPIDVITLSDRRAELPSGTRVMAYAGEIQANTPSVANAKAYAQIIRDRAVCRLMSSAADRINELAHEEASIEDKISLAQSIVLGLDSSGSEGECQMVGDILMAHVEILQDRLDKFAAGVTFDGLGTGIPDLDGFTQGLKSGQMIVVAGRPAMGKTTLAMNIAADVAINQKKPVLVISLEMSKTQLMDRLLAAVGGIPLPSLKTGECSNDYVTELNAAVLRLRDAPIAVSDVPVMTMPRIRSIARRQSHRMGGLGLVVIDYLGLVEGEGKGRTEDVTAMSRQIKLLARELDCPVIILSQLNRGCEGRPDKRPVLSDLRESGAIEQDADVVLLLHRDRLAAEGSPTHGVVLLDVAKNRHGPTGEVRLRFEGAYSRFLPESV